MSVKCKSISELFVKGGTVMKTEHVFSKLNGKKCVIAVNLVVDGTFYTQRGILEYDGQGNWVKLNDTYININHIVYVYAIDSLE